jgi:hypothetical protein
MLRSLISILLTIALSGAALAADLPPRRQLEPGIGPTAPQGIPFSSLQTGAAGKRQTGLIIGSVAIVVTAALIVGIFEATAPKAENSN